MTLMPKHLVHMQAHTEARKSTNVCKNASFDVLYNVYAQISNA